MVQCCYRAVAFLIYGQGGVECQPQQSGGEECDGALGGRRDLSLREANGSLVWSTNTSNKGVVGMMFLDEYPGNLALINSSNGIVWQSYDYPTDILLPGQYLNPGMRIVSRVSDADPSEGSYSLVMEVGGLALYDLSFPSGPQPYWLFGCYSRNDSFSVHHTCNEHSLFSLRLRHNIYEHNNSEYKSDGALIMSKFSGTIPDNSKVPEFCNLNASACSNFLLGFDYSSITFYMSFLRIESSGFLRGYSYSRFAGWVQQLDLLQNDSCLLPSPCGPYGICSSGGHCTCPAGDSFQHTSNYPSDGGGCSPTPDLSSCGIDAATIGSSNPHQHFLNLSGIEYFPDSYAGAQNYTTLDSCLNTCLHNCSCLAVFYHTDTGSCFPHMTSLGTLRNVTTASFSAFLKIQKSTPKSSKGARLVQLGGIVGGVVVGMCMLLFIMVRVYRIKSAAAATRRQDEDDDMSFLQNLNTILPTRYSYKDLQDITHGFNTMLGVGGFGKVYEGILEKGQKVAVKKLESRKQGKKEFHAEVAILGGIHHFNLVRLCGFCAEGPLKLLVYEYMANGSLDRWLFQDLRKENQEPPLSWPVRFQIALGTARGLAYLHEDCKERILHLDIKPQNILLDQDFNAKISDFGLSKHVQRDQSLVMTLMRGTPGYLAPEWLLEGGITNKTDVYSFGMLLLEIVSGRKNLDRAEQFASEKSYFPAWALKKAEEGALSELTDVRLGEDVDEQQAHRMIITAFHCIQDDPSMRPSMGRVVQMLGDACLQLSVDECSNLVQGISFSLKPLARRRLAAADDASVDHIACSSGAGAVASLELVEAR